MKIATIMLAVVLGLLASLAMLSAEEKVEPTIRPYDPYDRADY
jgi:hypothetical protein